MPLIHVPISPMMTIWNGLMAKAVRQMMAPAIDTLVPISKWKYLLTIFARMSSPPVEALMRNMMACEALSTSTKQSKSNHGSFMTLVWPGSVRKFCQG